MLHSRFKVKLWPQPLSTGLINALNLIIQANQIQAQHLSGLQHKCIELLSCGVVLKFTINSQGLFQISPQAKADCGIEIPLGVITAATAMHKLQQMQITGDQALAHQFLQIMAGLELNNLLYHYTPPGCSLGAYLVEQLCCHIVNYFKLLQRNSALSMQEYLQAELKLLALPIAVEDFYQQVDCLSEQIAVLSLRIKRLQDLALVNNESSR
jgi:ubiquinone biosynthesis protein UbiJ